MKTYNKFLNICLSAILLIVLTACGSSTEQSSNVKEDTENEVTIVNNDITTVYTEAPKRAISLNQHVTEIMLALGLEDSMVGTAYLDDKILPSLQEDYDQVPVLAKEYPTKEQVIDAEADFVYAGWTSGFSEKGIGTQEELKELGIHTYLHKSSDMTSPTLEDIFEDIQNIAKIFRVEERGDELIAQMKADVEKVQANLPEVDERVNVLIYDSGEKEIFTAGQNFMNEITKLAGGHNIFSDIKDGWVTVSKEDAVARDPEVIVVIDYGDTSAESKIEFLKQDPALKETPAVQNEHFVILPLSAASEGIRAAQAIEILAKGFYPENFKK
ncbi:ABC transporter substrate-binding protein [Peribacillus sp. Hz7]|uniref:ABC transporter substrate-binding protein n=1 Tax=Peribacillus sp. Hz7 TaxID=3344873 RepID=UPI0035C9E4EB